MTVEKEKFTPVFSIPHFLLSLVPAEDAKAALSPEPGPESVEESLSPRWRLRIESSRVFPKPLVRRDGAFLTCLLGHPIVGDRIDRDFVFKSLWKDSELDKEALRRLNGEFLIIRFDSGTGQLQLVNDRFTSFPFYYYNDPEGKLFYGTPYFTQLWQVLKRSGKLKLNEEALFEFMWLQRVLGTKTYAKDALFLPDASVFSWLDGESQIHRYWERDYTKSGRSFSQNASLMAELTRQSVRRKTSEGTRFGHFLSGGMDSRSVLAAFDDKGPLPVCFTATVSENRELRTAREIALAKGARHLALELDTEHYAKILEPSIRTIGGMYNYDHGLFYGYNDAVRREADICFHGHGFDYMFQGMYIPVKKLVFRGRSLYYSPIMKLPDDLAGFFISKVSYRVKNADLWEFVRPERQRELRDSQRSSVEAVLEAGRKLTDNPNDLWEYLTFHHISRHYSYPNHASIATYAEQRTVSFDNELFDFYLSLPVEHRLHGKIEKRCLSILDPRLAKIRSANTNLPVTASNLTQTLYQLAGFAKRRIIPEKPQGQQERTWLSREETLLTNRPLQLKVEELLESGALQELEFFDTDKLRDGIRRWLKGEKVPGLSGDMVQTALSLGTFLRIS
ncbi:MAG: hypothetical protein A2X49_03655 [Lentisphaerae bacterium GWF2_52_8]|nr:MAG: hypothetical protein A2X49_03655 [Lentisphaerae bacterium GWF2_52_8]